MQYFFIGERELVLAFGLVGVHGDIAVNRAEALDSFMRITGHGATAAGIPVIEERPKVLVLTEEVVDMLQTEVLEWQKKGEYPLIVEIPGLHGRLDGRKSMTVAIREAIGVSV